jgi:hypothetical protein
VASAVVAAHPAARSLAPKEHGAYGQLAFPLITALSAARPSVAAVLLALAAVLVFVAHEPVLIVLGQRGPRARREDGPRAVRRLVLLGSLAAASGGAGTWLAPADARWAIAFALVLATLAGGFVAARLERTAVGEIVAAAALCGAAVPVALASSVPLAVALAAFFAWSSGFAAVTLGVRAAVAHAKAPRSVFVRAAGVLAVTIGIVAAYVAMGRPLLLAGLPLALASGATAIAAPHPRHLKRVGWVLVAASVASAVAVITAA